MSGPPPYYPCPPTHIHHPPPPHYGPHPPPPHYGHHPPPHHYGHHSPPPPPPPPQQHYSPSQSYAYIPVPVVTYPMPYPETTAPYPETTTQYPEPIKPQPEVIMPPAPVAPVVPTPIEPEISWVTTTNTSARSLSGRALVGGHEGWDGSQLWVIRARHNGDLIPGKLAVRHNAAYIPYSGNEIAVQNIEVLCCKPKDVQWVPTAGGVVPYGAIPGGQTSTGETLYIGRAQHQLSLTPGKVHQSHGCLYISFSGSEVSHKTYDILCKVQSFAR